MNKKLLFLLFTIFNIVIPVYANNTTFVDVNMSHWGYEAIDKMVEDGVINGYQDNTFLPDKEITRAEFAKMFSIALDVDGNLDRIGYYMTINDVDFGNWAYDYIQSAAEYFPPIDNGFFKPDEYITREDAAYALAWRINPDVRTFGALDKFEDSNEISESKRYYFSLAVASGIINGYGNNIINPKGYLTRAEVCTMLNNIKYKLNLNIDYIKFGEVLKYTEITTNLNGPEKNKVNVRFTFEVPSIKNINVNITTITNKRISPDISYGKNEKYNNMPTVDITFSIEPKEEYGIFLSKLETLNGRSTHMANSILQTFPSGRLYITCDDTITKDTNIKFNWSEQYGIPNEKIIWYLNDTSKYGVIKDENFSISEDIIKNTSKKFIDKTINVSIVAKDDKSLENSLIIYRYNIFDIDTTK